MQELKELKNLLEQVNDAVDEIDTIPELSTIHNTTIEWFEDKEGINFTDREIMHTLDKLFFNGKTNQEILSHLEQLL